MKKYISVLFIIIVLIVFINFNNSKDILIITDEGSINNFRINSTNYNDEVIVKDIINILRKYNTEKTKNPFPMKTDEIEFEIDYMDNNNSIHIVLGKTNIVYGSGNKNFYKILNGEEMYLEIEKYLNEM